ncbi:AAA family ATPase [Nonomuraea sp. FMUSA5-5]|uniref:AAA family ATPase n=2 Tax=Nonomuraea composti TaxID=2720023 RepID=A0ABX1BT97_9ACTN|nr:AAA family ATPase [Nonomuraea sp. FMUSA5-5]
MMDKLQGYFGLSKTPFGRGLAPGMLHRHAAHSEAIARIAWCVAERELGVVTGEVGVGKTAATRAAIFGLDPARHIAIYLGSPDVGVRGIRTAIVTALGGVPKNQKATLIPEASDMLATEQAERGRTPVLVIDEAHMLAHDQLESVRMLTNFDMDSSSPFATLLIGQPTLKRKIKLGVLAALDQRISVRHHMTGMTPEETADYVRHHMTLAGRSDPLFSDDAIALIHETARGYPRSVNNLGRLSLLATYAAGKTIVDEAAARTAVNESAAPE